MSPEPSTPRPPQLLGVTEPHPPSRRSAAFLSRLAALQVGRPWLVLGIAAFVTAISILLALRLRMLTGFESLLPESRPSVQELARVKARTAGVSMLFVVLTGDETTPVDALREAGDALVLELDAVGPPWVGSVEDGVQRAIEFLEPRAGLFAPVDRLEQLQRDINARFEWEVARQTGALLDEYDDPPAAITLERVKATFGIDDDGSDRYPAGYYQSKDGTTLVVAIRSRVLGSDFSEGTEAIRRVRDAVNRVRPESFHSAIRWGLSGDLQTGISEYTAINRDLTDVGLTGAVLIASVVFLYYLRIRTLVTMLLTIGIGVAWTFGATQLTIGHLNMATGLLFTIVAGNGINFGIIFMARYLETRRRGATLADGIRIAHHETWLPTGTAGLAAGAAYGSLVLTEFRGFRDFGLIGGMGMVLCWIATYWTLPAILTVIERSLPLENDGLLSRIRRATQGGVAFGRPFAALALRAPRGLAAGGVALAMAGLAAAGLYARADPMEYDLRKIRTDERDRREEIRLGQVAEDITGYVGVDGMAIVVDDPAHIEPLRTELYRVRDAVPHDERPFERIHALQDYVPAAQAQKVPLLLAIKDKVLRARKRGIIADDDWSTIQRYLPPDNLTPFGIGDLPDGLARPFTESDGTRGRIVYISPSSNQSVHDARYLFRWADAYRETKLPDGAVVRGSGRAVIYADMWSAIVHDVPRAVLFSLLCTVVVVLGAFRGGRGAMAVLAALFVGVGWMSVPLIAMRTKLNFLNFIALPITFGIGVDYAVNIMQRYVREGAGGALTAVRETGGAVILCSLTTMLGYLALIRSANQSVRSMGVAAVVGEVTCLLAAVVVLPAGLVWLDRDRPRGARSLVSARSSRQQPNSDDPAA